jgi:ribonuclease HII
MLYHENQARKHGYKFIAGVDEAGRGPLAGPVVACALLLKNQNFKNRITDSKQLTALQRKQAFKEIIRKSFFGLGWVSPERIDSINILEATRLAMKKAMKELIDRIAKDKKIPCRKIKKEICFLIDGNFFFARDSGAVKNIIGGDGKSLSIACASIIAKVSRDRLMEIYDRIFPQYGFGKHKGYGTKLHFRALKKYGASRIHRKSFYPLKCQDEA